MFKCSYFLYLLHFCHLFFPYYVLFCIIMSLIYHIDSTFLLFQLFSQFLPWKLLINKASFNYFSLTSVAYNLKSHIQPSEDPFYVTCNLSFTYLKLLSLFLKNLTKMCLSVNPFNPFEFVLFNVDEVLECIYILMPFSRF